jgi:hypothetical protein
MLRKLVALAVLATPLFAQAGPVSLYNNLGPGGTANPSVGWAVGLTSVENISIASGFTAADSGYLTSLQISLLDTGTPAPGNPILLSLYTNSGSNTFGSLLETFTITSPLPTLPSSAASELTSVLHPQLTAGASYFLVAESPNNRFAVWQENITGATGLVLARYDAGSWSPQSGTSLGGFALNGDTVAPVPLPASAWLLISALACLALVSRRGQAGARG